MRRHPKRRARERRRRQRLAAAPATVRSVTLEARLVDFHSDGFSLETTTGLRPGQRRVFRLQGASGAAPLVGTVRWCRLRAVREAGDGQFVPVFRSGLSLEVESDPAARDAREEASSD